MAADYYSILARAVSRLAINNAQARQELYERARTVLVTELGRQEMPALGTVGERIVLETAILKVEAESQSQGEAKPEAFADYVPSHDAHDKIEGPFDVVHELRGIKTPPSENGVPGSTPDIASLLRKPARKPRQHRHNLETRR